MKKKKVQNVLRSCDRAKSSDVVIEIRCQICCYDFPHKKKPGSLVPGLLPGQNKR